MNMYIYKFYNNVYNILIYNVYIFVSDYILFLLLNNVAQTTTKTGEPTSAAA